MKCPKCGNEIKNLKEPCPVCGKKMTEREIKIERMLLKKSKEDTRKRNFFVDVGFAVRDFWVKIFDIKSLTSVKEFWYATMVNVIIALLGVIAYQWIGIVYLICTVIPGITCTIRRIKDSGREWFYLLLVLLPGAGFVVMIVLLSLPSYYKVIDESKEKPKRNKVAK